MNMFAQSFNSTVGGLQIADLGTGVALAGLPKGGAGTSEKYGKGYGWAFSWNADPGWKYSVLLGDSWDRNYYYENGQWWLANYANLYAVGSTDKAYGMWIKDNSGSAYDVNSALTVGYDGRLCNSYYWTNDYYGIRPVSKIKTGVNLVMGSNGKWNLN